MFVILAYDIRSTRSTRLQKIAVKYLHPLQKSVYEGYLSESALRSLKTEILRSVDTDQDSVVLYTASPGKMLNRELLGKCNHYDPGIL